MNESGAQGPSPNKDSAPAGYAVNVPAITLPKGGGAVRGIGEKLAANPVTGTGSLSVPIATSPGRSGFGPQLSLSYDSGAGNGPFGFGWTLALPSITRKTDKALPRYFDALESDVFVLAGAEDLVPVLDANGDPAESPAAATNPEYRIRMYSPRIEGLFARIERWTLVANPLDVHWQSISADNLLTVYGRDATSRIVDPEDPRRIFSWLMSETRDDRGNVILYSYRPEDGTGVDVTRASERNRGPQQDIRRTANRYLKRIQYGNRLPLLDDGGLRPRFLTPLQIQNAGWMFEVVFDYGEHDARKPTPGDAGEWTLRADAFSTFRAGFEVRTTRLCRRVLMFHHFPDEAGVGQDCLVCSTDFSYSSVQAPSAIDRIYTFLQAVTHSGYRRKTTAYLKRSIPSLEFEYTRPIVQDAVQDLDTVSLEHLPIGVNGAAYQWADLHGEGIPGILTEQGDGWFYKRNVSPISERAVEFAPLERVATKPNLSMVGEQAQLLDLAGDGRIDLVQLNGPAAGFFEHDAAEGWERFRAFSSRLNRDTRDPNLRFIDLDGDGHADVLITEDEALVWHPSLAEDGFGAGQRISNSLDEEQGPRVAFADSTQSIFLADISGDGLIDLVRIRNAEICYWPNLGYGRFGAKITMDEAPRFDHPDQFDPKRLRLADIDGSGTTDVIYLHRDGPRLYFNQSGNGWSVPQVLRAFPRVDDVDAIVPTDLLGNGTACLVWSSSLPGDAGRQMRYVDLMGGTKPHLMVRAVNNLGAETRVHYATSTKFYLQDRRDGKPWITKLPFPVHVVERVETFDYISRNYFVTRYAYHHGYFDGIEREFRGFAMVEQWDTEQFGALPGSAGVPVPTNSEAASHVPPVLTRSWFQTGSAAGRDLTAGYFGGPLLPETTVPTGLTADEEREAWRSLKGATLRQEVFALDGSDNEAYPYTVTEQNFTIRPLQSRARNRHGVFLTHACESVNASSERNPADPRIAHTLTLEVNDYGQVLKSIAVAYGRAQSPLLEQRDRTTQTRSLITYTESRVTNAIDDATYPDDHRTPQPAETLTYELTGFTPENNAPRFSVAEWTRNGFALLASAAPIPYEQTAGGTKQRRLIEHVRSLYRDDDLTTLLPVSQVAPLALPGESYKLALTTGLLASLYTRTRAGQPPEDLLPVAVSALLEGKGADEGGYVAMDGDWWIPSGRVFLSDDPNHTAAQERAEAQAHFFLPRRYRNVFDQDTVVTYDGPADPALPRYDLLVTSTRDAVGNLTTAFNDYRVLQPELATDPNGNRAAAAFDALGMVTATAVMGKETETLGDVLQGFDADPALDDLQNFIADPQAGAASMLGQASTRFVYDLERFQRAGQAPFAAMLARETHVNDPGGGGSRIQTSFEFSDGFGRTIQKKISAEAGVAPRRQAAVQLPTGDVRPGDLVRDVQGRLVLSYTPRRWVGSGRRVFNNKGKPVRQYEPFFSATPLHESEPEMTDTGVSAVLFYDPVGRVMSTLHPNHTYEKVVFDAWQQTTYDVNDTVAARGAETGDPRIDPDVAGYVRKYFATQPAAWQTWYAERIGSPAGDPERDAAEKAFAHADTPTTVHLDALGRPFLTLARNRFTRNGAVTEEEHLSRVELDLEGNQRSVQDAQGRIVMQYGYDMLGSRVRQASLESGRRWMLKDAAGKTICAWDDRRFIRRMTYDALRRPTSLYVSENGVERLAEHIVYGETQGDAANHRTRVYQVFDAAGVVSSLVYDFKGNLCDSRRELLPNYRQSVDWAQNPTPNDGTLDSRTTYDALNRPLTATAPDGSVHRPTFNNANLLERIDVQLRASPGATAFVANIDYDAKGQRERIVYANGAATAYTYDPLSLRLVRLRTTRPAQPDVTASRVFLAVGVVQDLHYTYDPAGNLTRVEDAALRSVFNGQPVEPVGRYTYDAVYRLIEATGREHIGQNGFEFDPAGGSCREYPFFGNTANPNNLQALRNYTEQYEYDNVGNFEAIRHRATGGHWTRRYFYEEPSLIDTAEVSNRLTRTTIGNGLNRAEAYSHDAHGNMTAMPHLTELVWDFKDQLRRANRGGGGSAIYVYDASGQRVRKVIESQAGTRQKERIYVGGFEVYREFDTSGTTVALERESLHVIDDKQRIALVETLTVNGGNVIATPVPLQRYQFGNHLGSASVELSDTGALISYEEYHPYGTTAFQAGRSGIEVSQRRYRYTGMERDEETGFSYHTARYYAPWLARWTSGDTSGIEFGVNLYAYGLGQPMRFSDPDGRSFWDNLAVTLGLAEPGPQPATPIPEEKRVLKPPELNQYTDADKTERPPVQTSDEKKAKGIGPSLPTFKGFYEREREERQRKADVQIRGTILVAGAGVMAVLPEAAPLLVELAGVSGGTAATGMAVLGTASGAAQEYGLTGKVTPKGLVIAAGFSSLGAMQSLSSLKALQAPTVTRGYISGGYKELMSKARAAAAGDVGALGEIQAAKLLRSEGYNVHFQSPTGLRNATTGKTADFLVEGERGTGLGGVPTDVLTPISEKQGNVLLRIAEKKDQARNFIVNLRHTPVTDADLGNVMSRLKQPGLDAPDIITVRTFK